MPQIGRAFLKLKDPQAQLALEHLYDAFQRLKVDKDSIDASSIASAVGKAMKDGELGPLERFLGGIRFARVRWLSSDTEDKQTLWITKPFISGGTKVCLFVDGSQAGVATALFSNGQRGNALSLSCLDGGGTTGVSADAVLFVNNGGTGDSIYDDSGAKLTAGGAWTPACSRRLKKEFRKPFLGQFLEKLKKLRISWFRYKKAPAEEHLGPCREDIQRLFGIKEPSDYDIASLAILGVQCLLERVEALEKRK